MENHLRIGIFGLGALGIRHLQALALVGCPLDISAVEPNDSAADAAEVLFANSDFATGSRFFRGAAGPIDIAIVATNSRQRVAATELAVSMGAKALILEKVLFAKIEQYEAVGQLLREARAKAWVNCARRTMSSFGTLQAMVHGRQFSYQVEGTGWGLGCNVIHHLDEFIALAGQVPAMIDASGLQPGYVPARRAGYIEFSGTLRATLEDGSRFEAICHPGEPGDRMVTVETRDAQATISQTRAMMEIESDGTSKSVAVKIPLQSQITAEHVRRILSGATPDLPDYETSSRLHQVMLAAFMAHLDRTAPGEFTDECPIT